MSSFYDILKAAKVGGNLMPYYETLFARKLPCSKYAWTEQTITGIHPLSFRANGTPLISWSMKGNGQQTGTPTPSAPIMPDFCGERTANLWDEEYPNISVTIQYIPLYVGNGSFTLSTTTPYDISVANLFLLSGNVSTGASTHGNGAWKNHNVTAQSESGYITIAYRHYSGTTSPADCKTMLSLGSTALPYEPFGYKLPITCGQTTPVYLGQTQTVRKIKKFVFDGTEEWNTASSNRYYFTLLPSYPIDWLAAVISHFEVKEDISATGCARFGGTPTTPQKTIIFNFDGGAGGITSWEAYLAQQYAAGTPVTIWYVLETPETGIVNEPLAKIGDHADELHSEDTTVSIPTVKGQNTLTVDTELPPSEISITGHIKEV